VSTRAFLPTFTAGDYKAAAIEKSEAGNLAAAIEDFRRAIQLDPYDAVGFNNLGVALMRHGVETRNVNELKESYSRFARSMVLKKDKNTKDNMKLVKNYMKSFGLQPGSNKQDNEDDDDLEEWEAHDEKKYRASLKKRIAKVCTNDQVRLTVTQKERAEGILGLKKFKKSLRILSLCGVVVFERLYAPELIKRLRKAQAKVVDDFLKGIEEDIDKTNTTSSEQRSPGRYELVNPLKTPFSDESFVLNPLLAPLMTRVLGSKRLEIDTHSSVTSLPHTPEQHWHRDAGFLFEHEQVKKQLPPHGLVIFVPLVKVTDDMGPTEFLTGSHIQCPQSEMVSKQLGNWQLNECDHTGATVATPASSGSAVIFDLRILHRGLANKSSKKRPLMYMTMFQEWFIDHVNFNDKQTASFDIIPPQLKKILGRIDNKEYTLLLEKTLEDLGVQVSALQSDYNFRKHTFQ
jgi:hypothetical protein